MLAFAELGQLERRLRSRKVLSVFVDTSAPEDGSAWRVKLDRALARLDATSLSSGDRTARELCMAHLRTALEGRREAPGRPGWVAYVTTDDVVAAEPVPVAVETGVFWDNGIVVGPLAPALPRTSSRLIEASRARGLPT
jgi:hypothetical protein